MRERLSSAEGGKAGFATLCAAQSPLLVDAPQERERIAELDLRAGERAKASAAYAAALTYFAAGSELLGADR